MFRKSIFIVALAPGFILAQPKKTTTPAKTKIPVAVKSSLPSPLKTSIDSFSYAIAMNIGFNMKQQGVEKISPAMITRAFDDVMKGKTPLMDMQVSNDVVNKFFGEMAAKKSAAARGEGDKFLAENKKRPGVTTTQSGLQYEVITQGNGAKPVDSNTVKVHYTGTLLSGKKFDSSVDRGQPIEFGVTGVIAGWTEALKLMPVGSKWKLFIPSELGYGDRGQRPDIGPGAVLIFEVELLDITK